MTRWASGPSVSFGLVHGWRRPRPVQRFPTWGIQPHGEVKLACRCRQPIGFLVRARRCVLNVNVERSIAVELELVTVAECKTTKRIWCLEAVLVVERHRPKGIGWRKLALIEVQHVTIGSAVRLA